MIEDENDSADFDFDSGVSDIAEGLGLGSAEAEEIEDEVDDYDSEQLSEDSQPAEEKAEQTTESAIVREPPKSWAKEQHEIWGQLPDSAKDYIETREKQMLDGIEQYRQGHHYGLEMAKAIEPYRQELQAAGVNEAEAISSLLHHHRALTSGSLEQRQQALLQIGIATGIIPKEGQTQADLERQQLEMQLRSYHAQQERQQQEFQRQQAERLSHEIESFAKDKEHFDTVVDDMLPLLRAGLSLQDAYDKAVWANPTTRSAELQKQMNAEIERKRQEAEAAKKAASANVRTQQRTRTADAPRGDWGDTMAETLRNIRKR